LSEYKLAVAWLLRFTEASAITMPAATVEKLLPSASLTLTINGVDYVTSKNIVSLETSWKNNIRMDAVFYPGSDFQTPATRPPARSAAGWSLATRGRASSWPAYHNSTELTLLKAQTAGTAVIHLPFDTNNSLDITWQKVAFATAEVGGPPPYLVRWYKGTDSFELVGGRFPT
jgi:hypothetical protein